MKRLAAALCAAVLALSLSGCSGGASERVPDRPAVQSGERQFTAPAGRSPARRRNAEYSGNSTPQESGSSVKKLTPPATSESTHPAPMQSNGARFESRTRGLRRSTLAA